MLKILQSSHYRCWKYYIEDTATAENFATTTLQMLKTLQQQYFIRWKYCNHHTEDAGNSAIKTLQQTMKLVNWKYCNDLQNNKTFLGGSRYSMEGKEFAFGCWALCSLDPGLRRKFIALIWRPLNSTLPSGGSSRRSSGLQFIMRLRREDTKGAT